MREATIRKFTQLDYSGTEALNTICTNLLFSGREQKKIMITSYMAGAGKSFMSMHMLHNLSRRGKRVVLVDCDLRKSFLVRRYGMETQGEWLGLSHYLAGMCGLEDIIYKTNLAGACIIPAGKTIATPIPLLDSPDFSRLLDTLAKDFDLVLVDTPPIGVVIDAAQIAPSCDGTLLIVNYDNTRRRELLDCKKQIERTGCKLLGCIINKVTFDSLASKKYYNKGYYYNYYSKYYTDNAEGKEEE